MNESRSDFSSSAEGSSIKDEEQEKPECGQGILPGKSRVVRFSEAQRACLNSYYRQGMVGVGKKEALLISKAAKDTHLSTNQVKVHVLLVGCRLPFNSIMSV